MAYWLALNDLGATEQSIILGLKGRREKVIPLCTEYGHSISHLGRIPCHDDCSSCTVKLNMTNNTMIHTASHPPTLTPSHPHTPAVYQLDQSSAVSVTLSIPGTCLPHSASWTWQSPGGLEDWPRRGGGGKRHSHDHVCVVQRHIYMKCRKSTSYTVTCKKKQNKCCHATHSCLHPWPECLWRL